MAETGGRGTPDHREVLSVTEENDVLRIDAATDFLCEGDIVCAEGGTGLRRGEVRNVGGDIVGGRGRRPNGIRDPHWGLILPIHRVTWGERRIPG